MGLQLPVVSETLGPTWASEVNAALTTIDSHDHSPGSGTLVSAAGININDDLTFNAYNATNLRTLRLGDQTSITLGVTDVRALYVKGGDLYYRNAGAQEVQVTVGSAVAGASGSIASLTSPASASFSSGIGTFIWQADTGKYAKMANADIALYEYNNASANPITLKSPASVGSAYTITLPGAVPAQSGVVSMNTSGTLSTGLADGSLSAPGLAFASDLNTGAYRIGTDNWALVSGGTANWTFSTTVNTTALPIRAALGSQSAPSYSFTGDTDTGMYSSGADSINFSAGGGSRLALDASGVYSSVPISGTSISLSAGLSATTGTFSGALSATTGTFSNVVRGPGGSSAAPTYSFSGETNTGIYNPSSATLALVTNGSTRLSLSSSGLTATAPHLSADGSSLAPAYAFSSQVSTGMYRPASAAIGFAAGLAEIARINVSGLSFGGDTASSMRWKLYTGSITAGGTTTITAPGEINGVFGYDVTLGHPIDGQAYVGTSGSTSSVALYYSNSPGDSTSVVINNPTGSTHDYRVIVFY